MREVPKTGHEAHYMRRYQAWDPIEFGSWPCLGMSTCRGTVSRNLDGFRQYNRNERYIALTSKNAQGGGWVNPPCLWDIFHVRSLMPATQQRIRATHTWSGKVIQIARVSLPSPSLRWEAHRHLGTRPPIMPIRGQPVTTNLPDKKNEKPWQLL